jgi:hypothetical protein
MDTAASRFARYIAMPVVSAGIIGGAAIGLAGAVCAATSTQPTGPGHSYAPSVKAQPAPVAQPGSHWHQGVRHVADLQPSYTR